MRCPLPTAVRLFALAATTTLAVAQGSWVQVPTAPGDPTGYGSGRLEFAAATGEVLLYGAYVHPTAPAALWSWDGAAWTLLQQAAAPGGRWDHAMSYGDVSQNLVVFGGGAGLYLGDTWELDVTARAWTQRFPANSPSPRFRMPMVYDSTRDVHVLFGGEGPGWLLDDTWEWDGTDWTLVPTTNRPPARRAHMLAYDALRHRTILFGGVDFNGNAFGDTWVYDGANWTQLQPAVSPPSRSHAGLEFDRDRGVAVLFGGESAAWGAGNASLTDLWEWDGVSWTERTAPSTPAGGGWTFTYDAARRECVLYLNAPETWRFRGLGATYCPNAPNSTGLAAHVFATGSSLVAQNDLTLHVVDLPAHAFAYFIVSRSQGHLVQPGGSQGTLCLSGQIGRYLGPGEIQNSGASGAISLALDLAHTPATSTFVAIAPGETWHFQAWHRDVVGGAVTSNFTDALSVSFH